MKYVIVDVGLMEIPIIFPNIVNHNQVLPPNMKVVSAGEFSLWIDIYYDTIQVSCSGSSISLGVKSRGKEDEELIKRAIEKY